MAATPTVAVFDLDGTITFGDTFVAYLRGFIARHWRRAPRSAQLIWDVVIFYLDRIDNTELKRRFLACVLQGISRPEVDAWTRSFVEQYLAHALKPEACRKIEHHRRAGHFLILVSASLDIYVEAIGARLGFDRVIATRVAWDPQWVLTGDIPGPNLHGRAKVEALESVLAAEFPLRPWIVAYADHHADLPLLLYANEGVAVDPTSILKTAADYHHLRLENWQHR